MKEHADAVPMRLGSNRRKSCAKAQRLAVALVSIRTTTGHQLYLMRGVENGVGDVDGRVHQNENCREYQDRRNWITKYSRLAIAATTQLPTPFHANTFSVNTAPPSKLPTCRPMIVTTGNHAFRIMSRRQCAAR